MPPLERSAEAPKASKTKTEKQDQDDDEEEDPDLMAKDAEATFPQSFAGKAGKEATDKSQDLYQQAQAKASEVRSLWSLAVLAVPSCLPALFVCLID